MIPNLDFDRLRRDLAPVIVTAIEHLISGSAEDVEQFALAIGRDLVEAQIAGDEAMKAQLVDQLTVLAEINNIRLRNGTWLVVSTVISSLTRAVVAGALATFL